MSRRVDGRSLAPAVAAFMLPVMLSCATDPGVAGKTTRPRGTATVGTQGQGPAPLGSDGSPIPNPTGSPEPGGSGDVGGGLDLGTDRVPTATPLGTATPRPTEVPRAYGDTDGEPIPYGVTTAGMAFAASGRGFVILADGKLGEFPSVGPGGPFTYAGGVTGLVAAAADGAGGLWVVGAGSRELLRLTGGALNAGTRLATGFTPSLLAADSTRVWVSSAAGEGMTLAVSGLATATVTFAEIPAALAADGGGAWAVGASGSARYHPAPGSSPAPAVALGGDLGALAAADGGGVWAAIKGATPSVALLTRTASRSATLTAGETPLGVAKGGFGTAWALTDKALYLIETMPGDVLVARRYARTEQWLPGGFVSDPDDSRKIYVSDPAGKAVRRLFVGS